MGNFLFSPYGWPLLRAYGDLANPPTAPAADASPPVRTLTQLFASLECDASTGKATFTAGPAHSSLGGPLHGGAQAVLLERAAESAIPSSSEEETDSSAFHQLDSLHLEYMSAPDLTPEIRMTKTAVDTSKMAISAELWSRGKLRSTGIFRYSKL